MKQTDHFAGNEQLALPSNFTLTARYRDGQGAGSGCFSAERRDVKCGFAHAGVRIAKLTADVGRTAFLTISDPWLIGHARFAYR